MDTEKRTVLVVEDEPEVLELYSKMLEEHGFECARAKNGIEGLALAETKKPDIVLLDLRMPEMDGIAMLHELRKKDFGKNTPVIVLSGVDDEQHVSDAMAAGVLDYFEKASFNPEELVARINERINKKK